MLLVIHNQGLNCYLGLPTMEIPTSLISQAHIHLQYLFCKLSNQYTLVSHFTCIYYCGIQCTILMQTSVWYQSAMGKAVLSRSDWHRNINWGVSFVSKNLLYVFSKIIHFDKAIEMFRLPARLLIHPVSYDISLTQYRSITKTLHIKR